MAKKVVSPPEEEGEGTGELNSPEGETFMVEDEVWSTLRPAEGCIMECHYGSSSLGLGLGEDWFAVLVKEVKYSTEGGVLVGGAFLGVEVAEVEEQVSSAVGRMWIHLCPASPCLVAGDEDYIHVTRIRLWRKSTFDTSYLSKVGKRRVTEAIKKDKPGEEKAKEPKGPKRGDPSALGASDRGRGRGAGVTPRRKVVAARKDARDRRGRGPKQDSGTEEAIHVESEDEDLDGVEMTEEEKRDAGLVDRASLKVLLQGAKERMLGGGATRGKGQGEGALTGGRRPVSSSSARAETRLVAGTDLDPRRATPLALTQGEAPRGDISRSSKQRKRASGTTSLLLAQAEKQEELRRKKKRGGKKDKKIGKKLLDLLGGRKKKKKGKKGRKKNRRKVKRDPEDPSSDGSSGEESSSYSESSEDGSKESDSEISYEPPLRRKALESPGSVLEMLVRLAQEQLDKGALMETEGGGVASGIKITTYFALLIRPYFAPGSPLLRELYALAQAIDLLRVGKLAETGDALASRFVAVHTALNEGSWATASQLELYPLENTQSASTATMLQAQRHKKLVLKSQGYNPGKWNGKGRGGWRYQEEKGSKGEGKGKGRGKKGGRKGRGQWGNNQESNPWKENQWKDPAKEDPPKK